MIGTIHGARAVSQFAAAAILAAALLVVLGGDVRSVLLANLAACLLAALFALGSLARGSLTVDRRLGSAWPTLGILVIPVTLTGWDLGGTFAASWQHDVALAVAATLPFGLFLGLQTAFVPILPPPASEVPGPAASTARSFTYLVLVLVFGVLLASLAARAALPASDGASAAIFALLAAAFALNGVHCALAPALHLSRQGALLPRFAAGATALNLILNVMLVPPLGAVGAALAALLSFAALAAATFRASQRAFPWPVEQARIAKIAAAAAIVLLAASRWPDGPAPLTVSSHLAAALLGFPIVLALAGFSRAHERDALRRIVLRRHA